MSLIERMFTALRDRYLFRSTLSEHINCNACKRIELLHFAARRDALRKVPNDLRVC